MTAILEKWFSNVATQPSMVVTSSGMVEGVREKALGPRSDYARITVAFEPATQLEVDCTAENRDEL